MIEKCPICNGKDIKVFPTHTYCYDCNVRIDGDHCTWSAEEWYLNIVLHSTKYVTEEISTHARENYIKPQMRREIVRKAHSLTYEDVLDFPIKKRDYSRAIAAGKKYYPKFENINHDEAKKWFELGMEFMIDHIVGDLKDRRFGEMILQEIRDNPYDPRFQEQWEEYKNRDVIPAHNFEI